MRTFIPSTAGMSETAACPLSPIAGGPSALPSHASSSSSSQFTPSFLPAHSMPAQVRQCGTALLHLSRYYTVWLKLSISCVCFLCTYYLCEKHYKSITVHTYMNAQSCPTLCNPMDCGPPGSSVHGIQYSKNTAVGCHSLLQGISLIQGLNPGLLHCKQIPYHLSHQRSSHII